MVYRLRCMNYYEPVMLLPYVFRIPPAVNTTPSSFNSIPWDPEEEEVKIWHCTYNATLVITTGYKTNVTETIITAIS